MAGVQPYVVIEPPDVEPRPFGLFSVARDLQVTDDEGVTDDVHWQYGGVEYEPIACYPAGFYPLGINAAGGAGGSKTLQNAALHVKSIPFAIYAGVQCGSIGHVQDFHRQRALRVLDLSAQFAAEDALWNGAGGGTPKLNDASTTTVVGTATELTSALGQLEDWLGTHYNGRGVIHATRRVGILAGAKQLVRNNDLDPGKLSTPVGTPYSFGAGYDGTGPGAAAPASGSVWIYATGALWIRRGEPFTPADFAQALDRTNNVVDVLAEQTNILTYDCAVGAALVDLTK